MTTDNAHHPIGVFDSGVGGLTVLKALRRRLPHENFLYLGDTARLPYGTKSTQSVTRYALQTTRFLVDQGVKLLVVACNTASSAALPALAAAYPGLPVVGVIEPGARACCAQSESGRIAVIGTEGTVRRAAYQNAIRRIRPEAEVRAQACPMFVALAEEGWIDGEVAEAVARKYLEPLVGSFGDEKPDSLVLGCTHFPLLVPAIRKVLDNGIHLVDSAETTADEVSAHLCGQGLCTPVEQPGVTRFFATDDAARFAKVGGIFLNRELSPEEITIVDL